MSDANIAAALKFAQKRSRLHVQPPAVAPTTPAPAQPSTSSHSTSSSSLTPHIDNQIIPPPSIFCPIQQQSMTTSSSSAVITDDAAARRKSVMKILRTFNHLSIGHSSQYFDSAVKESDSSTEDDDKVAKSSVDSEEEDEESLINEDEDIVDEDIAEDDVDEDEEEERRSDYGDQKSIIEEAITQQCQHSSKNDEYPAPEIITKAHHVGKKSEATIKDHAMKTGIMDKQWSQTCLCKTTTNPGQCLKKITVYQIQRERTWIFGPSMEPPPTAKQRGDKMKEILEKRSILDVENKVTHISLLEDSMVTVCESAYMVIAGFSNSIQKHKPKKWLHCKKLVNGEIDDTFAMTKEDRKTKSGDKFSPKQFHAWQWLRKVGDLASDLSVNANRENFVTVPYSTVPEMWKEYKMDSLFVNNDHVTEVASYKTFQRMWKKQTNYQKYRSKGTFATCSSCNMANRYLSQPSQFHFTEHDRNILRTYKRKHLQQQEEARTRVEDIKNRCRQPGENGRAMECLFFIDAMSTWAGNTPKAEYLSGRTNKSDTGVFQNRVMGVEITCLDIDIFVLYHADELVKGGANFMIEVQRLAFHELQVRLAAKGLDMPRVANLQYDNCSENKNKYMFMYISLLLELGWFDQIDVGFLVVGHTHAPIDQKYSCIKSRLGRAKFIASPKALWKLLGAKSGEETNFRGNRSRYVVPAAQYKVSVVHDYKAALEPYFETAVSRYNIPFNFRFKTIGGIAVAQTQMFVNGEWFPRPPRELKSAATIDDVFDRPVFFVPPPLLSAIGGKERLYENQDLSQDNFNFYDLTTATSEQLATINSINKIIPVLQTIENKAYLDQEMRFEVAEEILDGSGNQENDLNKEKALDVRVNKLTNADISQAALAFNNGTIRQRDSTSTSANSISMAATLAEYSNAAEGFLTFFSASERGGALPPLSTVKPTRIAPFVWVREKSKKELQAHNDDDEEDIAGEFDRAAAVMETDDDTSLVLIPKPAKMFEASVRSAKSAAVQALQRVKDRQFQTAPANSEDDPGDTTFHERFGSKHIVYPADVRFYKDHESVEAMARKFEEDILEYEQSIEPNNKGFEWWITYKLTDHEISLRDQVMVERADAAVAMVEMCKQLFLTKKHEEEKEIVSRVTNDAKHKKARQEFEKNARKRVTEERKKAKHDKTEDERRKAREDRKRKVDDSLGRVALQAVGRTNEANNLLIIGEGARGGQIGIGQGGRLDDGPGGRGRGVATASIGRGRGGRGRGRIGIRVDSSGDTSNKTRTSTSEAINGTTDATNSQSVRPEVPILTPLQLQAMRYGDVAIEIDDLLPLVSVANDTLAEEEVHRREIAIANRRRDKNKSDSGIIEQTSSILADVVIRTITPPLGRNNSTIALSVLPEHLKIAQRVHSGMIAELRKSLVIMNKQARIIDDGNTQSKKRRLQAADSTVAAVSKRLCSDLAVSSVFYKNVMTSLPKTFCISVDNSSNLGTERERELFISSFCVAMEAKYGCCGQEVVVGEDHDGQSKLEKYIQTLESMELQLCS